MDCIKYGITIEVVPGWDIYRIRRRNIGGGVIDVEVDEAILGLFRDWDKHPELRRLLIQLQPSLRDPWPWFLSKLIRYHAKRTELILKGELSPDPGFIISIGGIIGGILTGIGLILSHLREKDTRRFIARRIRALAHALGVEDKYEEALRRLLEEEIPPWELRGIPREKYLEWLRLREKI